MQLLDRLKRWLRLPRSFESVMTELVEGLENGTIVLTKDGEPARPAELQAPPAPGAETPVPTTPLPPSSDGKAAENGSRPSPEHDGARTRPVLE